MVGINDMFNDADAVQKIKKKLPELFAIAESEASRGGKIGMEIGSVRERILISLLRCYFGKKNVDDDIPITGKETDVILSNSPISIKTKTGTTSGIKIVWTVDWDKIKKFVDSYNPSMDMLLAQIVWGMEKGGLFFIPLKVQKTVFKQLGRESYFTIPRRGTNPRGVMYSKIAMEQMLRNDDTISIKINWVKPKRKIDIYKKWDEYWEMN
ncbi:MAG: ThaI family type II restriction endonuclease [Thaumarchaeota archaeon]|nr:ThaI family type II restriction endonuclease [Nitrososphaerota archaeon]